MPVQPLLMGRVPPGCPCLRHRLKAHIDRAREQCNQPSHAVIAEMPENQEYYAKGGMHRLKILQQRK